MKIIRNNIIPFPGYKAVNIFGILFVRKNANIKPEDLNHEEIHTAQMKEMAYIGFYVWYFLEWLLCLLVSGFSFGYAYHDISLEEEAHLNDKNLEYLKTRKHYSWWSYIKLESWKKNKN